MLEFIYIFNNKYNKHTRKYLVVKAKTTSMMEWTVIIQRKMSISRFSRDVDTDKGTQAAELNKN